MTFWLALAAGQLVALLGILITLLVMVFKSGKWVGRVDAKLSAIFGWQEHHEESHHRIDRHP